MYLPKVTQLLILTYSCTALLLTKPIYMGRNAACSDIITSTKSTQDAVSDLVVKPFPKR